MHIRQTQKFRIPIPGGLQIRQSNYNHTHIKENLQLKYSLLVGSSNLSYSLTENLVAYEEVSFNRFIHKISCSGVILRRVHHYRNPTTKIPYAIRHWIFKFMGSL